MKILIVITFAMFLIGCGGGGSGGGGGGTPIKNVEYKKFDYTNVSANNRQQIAFYVGTHNLDEAFSKFANSSNVFDGGRVGGYRYTSSPLSHLKNIYKGDGIQNTGEESGKGLIEDRWWHWVSGDPVSGLPSGTHVYGGSLVNSVYSVLILGENRELSQQIAAGTIELTADFDNLTGLISGSTTGSIAFDSTLTGNFNINSSDGSLSGSGNIVEMTNGETYETSIIGSFHGNQAESVTGVIRGTNSLVGGYFAANKVGN